MPWVDTVGDDVAGVDPTFVIVFGVVFKIIIVKRDLNKAVLFFADDANAVAVVEAFTEEVLGVTLGRGIDGEAGVL